MSIYDPHMETHKRCAEVDSLIKDPFLYFRVTRLEYLKDYDLEVINEIASIVEKHRPKLTVTASPETLRHYNVWTTVSSLLRVLYFTAEKEKEKVGV